MSTRRFKVKAHLDGASEVTVEITPTPEGDAVISVRPKHKRVQYTGLLSDVAEIVAARHSKALAAQNGIAVPVASKKLRKF